ncbi:MAG: AAA family ATPase [Candidatus Sericytochromatia bacterium]|nr:AAA family ATPase [Candidatus Tanganyikabacteria bacterium]
MPASSQPEALLSGPPPPTGVVTLVFTDVQGSTVLWERQPTAMHAALGIHNRLLRDLLAEHGGYEVKTEGDAFMVAFAAPDAAVAWCLAAQEALLAAEWPADLLSQPDAGEERDPAGMALRRGLRVRMGVHAGEPFCVPDPLTGRMDYFGPMVNRAARVGGAAHGGQVVVSGGVWAALGDAAPPRAAARDLGEHRLKGLDTPERLVQLLPEGLAGRTFEPPKSQAGPRANFKPDTTSFVGRERDLAAIREAFAGGAALVTLLGPGGTGKTRLSRRYGEVHLGDHPGGVWFCDLTEAHDLDGVCAAVGRAIGVPLSAGQSTEDQVEQLGNAIAGHGKALVILDNFEQVVADGPASVGLWLAQAPDARFLASSREVLRLPGEVVLELAPLGVPGQGDRVADAEAVKLFVDRVRAVRRDFLLTPDDEPTVAEIVRQLDGIPLAIELAASRMGVLSPAKLLERLPRRFDLLASGNRGASARQATLGGLIDWSWRLLQPWEQAALGQCAIFRGGFTLEAAEAVLDLSGFPEAPFALDVLQALRDKSLLRAYEQGGDFRFGMYISIREFAESRLAHPTATYDRHAAYYLAEGEAWAARLEATNDLPALACLLAEAENLLIIHDRALATAPLTPEAAARAARVALALDLVLRFRGSSHTHLEMLDRAKAAADQVPLPDDLLARLLLARAWALYYRSRFGELTVDAVRALDVARRTGDRDQEGLARFVLGLCELKSGNPEGGIAGLEAALALGRELDNGQIMVPALLFLGQWQVENGRLAAARACYDEALVLARRFKMRRFEYIVVINFGILASDEGDLAEVRRWLDLARDAVEAIGDRFAEGLLNANFGDLELEEGDLQAALRYFEAAVARFRDTGSLRQEGSFLGRLGYLQQALGRPEAAELAFERAEALLTSLNAKAFLGALAVWRGDADLSEAVAMADRSDEIRFALRVVGRR